MAWLEHYPDISLEGLSTRKTTETSVSILSVLAEIQSDHFLKMSVLPLHSPAQ
jgi:hypothetical protein